VPKITSREQAKELSKKAHTKEAHEKRSKTIEEKRNQRLIQGEILNTIRDEFFKVDKNNKTYYERFLDTFMNIALNDMNSKPAQLLAQSLFSADILSKLDAETDKIMAKDIMFTRYRIDATLFDKQKAVINDRFSSCKSVICGRRSGKTDLNAKMLVDACAEPNTPCCYIHLTFSNGVAQVFDNIVKAAETAGLVIVSKSENDGDIIFSNGSSIRIRGNANSAEAEKVRGFKYKLVIIDECQSQRNLRYLVEEVIQPLQLDFEKHFLILTGTPPRVPHTFFESAYKGHEYTSYHWDLRDNPFIPNAQKVIEEICAKKGLTLESPLIQREYLGLIVYDTEALVYKDYKTYKDYDGDFVPDRVYIGVDFGFSDYNAVITLLADTQRKKAYVTGECKFNKATITEIVEAIKKAVEEAKAELLRKNHDVNLASAIGIYCDTNEKSIAYELSQTYRLPAYCAYKYDKLMGIAQLAEFMRVGQVKIKAGGIIADEAEQILFKRDEDDNILSEIDDDVFHPDAMDALLYASRQFAFDIGAESGGQGKRI
jgi:ATP:corrinoid adenosyltransferase